MIQGSSNFTAEDLTIAVYKGFYTQNSLNGLEDNYELLGSFTLNSDLTASGTFTFDSNWSEYTFLIKGKTSGGSAGYSFGLATSVPEPAEYAMMLAGLGVVGWAARRRKVKA
jgi:hypothetical protein